MPFSDIGPIVVPEGVPDEDVLFLSDILPTGWMAAENTQIEPGDTVAVWGCGPVGLFAICHQLNSTPRKCLGYRTPAQVFREKLMEGYASLP